MIASDGWVQIFGEGVPHPRSYGTFARVLGVYVRERNTITLEDAIRRMTSFPAQRLRLNDRGILRPGMKADVAIFDPAQVRDMATFEKPHQYAVGFSSVIVNGQVVFDGKQMTAARPGKVVYGGRQSESIVQSPESIVQSPSSSRPESGGHMRSGASLSYLLVALVCITMLLASWNPMSARQAGGASVAVDNDDLGGIVTGPKGPEAGVWVIAETTDLPTKFVKIVVTNDRGQYLIPDLPKANYNVWVRGYGLIDSPKTQSVPGKVMNLTAVTAPNPHAAAQYYPAGYWLSLMKVPDKSEFPGTGDTGNGISPSMRSQAQWLRSVKSGGCTACHQIGNKAMREIPKELGNFPSSVAAWDRRIQSGQAGGRMSAGLNNFGRRRALEMFADWTDRIAAGEVPPAPPRPRGLERNIVITQWDWADPKSYLHDSVSTDRRNPRINANGLIYGALELSSDYVPVLDPVRHTVTRIPLVRARSKDAADQPRDARVVSILGRRGDLDEQEQRAQSDARRERAPLADVCRQAVGKSRLSARRDRHIRRRKRFR